MSVNLNNYRLSELQQYLKTRGVTVTGYNKAALKEIVLSVQRLNLPTDPDFQNDSLLVDIRAKIVRAGIPDQNPLEMDGYTPDFTHIPSFGLIDIFNYMIFNKSEYDGKQLKGYKSFEDYRLFYDGHVEKMLYNPISDTSAVCVFKAQVKPTQRDKTYLNKNFYDLWFVLDKEDGYVVTGHCECIGGADGACRHLAAALYELEAFEIKSCTDGEYQWVKRARRHDVPVPVRNLSIVRAKYHGIQSDRAVPHCDLYDPRSESDRQPLTDTEKRHFGLKLQEMANNAQALDIRLHPEDRSKPSETNSKDVSHLSILNKARFFVEKNDISVHNINEKCYEFRNSLAISESDVSSVMEKNVGQSSNTLWHTMRKGRITASTFREACNYVDKDRQPPESYIKTILGENSLDDDMLPPALKWGRSKEATARSLYGKIVKSQNLCRSVKVNEVGLLISQSNPALACSADGVVVCKCKKQHIKKLVVIKCPYSLRECNPRDVAVKKHCMFNLETNRWEVSEECPYYDQIQGQLGLYNLSECDVVIYTTKGIHISTAVFNEQYFMKLVEKAEKLYYTNIVPIIFKRMTAGD